MAYQRAIEEVYWRHRIWPKERPDPKPPLDAVMSQAQLEKKVEDYVSKSQALEDYWQRPITAEQLQAEMDLTTKHTKQPEVLHELFEALGNDPFVIAECLARPTLADRLLRNWYAHDYRIHGELKKCAEADLQAYPTVEQMKQTSGMYCEIDLVRSDSPPEEANRGAGHAVRLNSREWDETVQELAAKFHRPEAANGSAFGVWRRVAASKDAAPEKYDAMPLGILSPLQEDETRYYALAVIGQTNDRLKLATVTWLKEPLETWLAGAVAKETMASATSPTPTGFTLPEISPSGGSCVDNSWTPTAGQPDSRVAHTSVWTGSEMIIWGGQGSDGILNTGGRYNPIIDNWTATSNTNAPTGLDGHTAVWTGKEMIIWGGVDINDNVVNTGARYDPGTDSWAATSTTNAPAGRAGHTAVWTGSEMIIWGGNDASGYFTTGGRYNPITDNWTFTSTVNAPAGRSNHTAVWTGIEMIIWGGGPAYPTLFNTGGRYDPGTDSWVATSITNAPSPRWGHTAVWTGSEMIIWAGVDSNSSAVNTGARYNPSTNSWIVTSMTNVPDARAFHTAIWSGSEMIVWGGNAFNTGGRYNPSTDNWVPTNTTNAPAGRASHTAVWTGSEMIIWGGNDSNGFFDTGGRYNAASDSWTAINAEAPSAQHDHTAVWTGSEMIVWGGKISYYLNVNTGGRYDPITDSWTGTSVTDAPSARYLHTAIWTGSEMIVWGGSEGYGDFNTGGRYFAQSAPSTPTPTPTPPIPGTGGRYDPGY